MCGYLHHIGIYRANQSKIGIKNIVYVALVLKVIDLLIAFYRVHLDITFFSNKLQIMLNN